MGLTSKLFAGDKKLEACLVSPSAHVTLGAVGDHVSKIQQALMLLDQITIDAGELQSKRYGQSTAAAVLSYKRKRSIINFNYQKTADNIVGQMTIARLDKEMADKEKASPLPPLPIPPLPPLPEPTSRSFSIRCAFRLGTISVTEPPPGGTTLTGGLPPQWYQVTDTANQRQAIYRFKAGFDNPSQVRPEEYRLGPRLFSISRPLALSQLGCNAVYTSSVALNSTKPLSQLELQLPVGRVVVPMFLHALADLRPITSSSRGVFQFSHFGFEPDTDLSQFS